MQSNILGPTIFKNQNKYLICLSLSLLCLEEEETSQLESQVPIKMGRNVLHKRTFQLVSQFLNFFTRIRFFNITSGVCHENS